MTVLQTLVTHALAVGSGGVMTAYLFYRYLPAACRPAFDPGVLGRNFIGGRGETDDGDDARAEGRGGGGGVDQPAALPEGWRETQVEGATYEAGKSFGETWVVYWYSEREPREARSYAGQWATLVWAPLGMFGELAELESGSISVIVDPDNASADTDGIETNGEWWAPDVSAATEAGAVQDLREHIKEFVDGF